MFEGIDEEELSFEIIYKPLKNDKNKIRIFGKKFVKNNKNNWKIIYKEQEYELEEYFENIDNNYNYKDLIKIKLILINNIIDFSYMFYKCKALLSFKDTPEINDSKMNKTSNNLSESCTLSSFPSESKTDFCNYPEKYEKFYDKEYNQLNPILMESKISSISKQYSSDSTDIDMSNKFFKDNPLSKLIISENCNMYYMFYECNSLISLPDMS